MKTTLLRCMFCLALGGFATEAVAQEREAQEKAPAQVPQQKIKIILTEGAGAPQVFEYNSMEEMRADERLKTKKLPPLPEKAWLPQLEHDKLKDHFHFKAESVVFISDERLGDFVQLHLEKASGDVEGDKVILLEERKKKAPRSAAAPANMMQGDRLMHRSLVDKELADGVDKFLKEHKIALEKGEKVVIIHRIDKMPVPPVPPVPPLPADTPEVASLTDLPEVPQAPAAPAAPAAPDAPAVPEAEGGWLEELVVYPNPGVDQLKVRFKSGTSGAAVLRLLDMNGQVVYEEQIPEAGNSIEKSIKVPDGKKGIFLLQIEQGGKKYNERVLLR